MNMDMNVKYYMLFARHRASVDTEVRVDRPGDSKQTGTFTLQDLEQHVGTMCKLGW